MLVMLLRLSDGATGSSGSEVIPIMYTRGVVSEEILHHIREGHAEVLLTYEVEGTRYRSRQYHTRLCVKPPMVKYYIHEYN